LVEVIMFPAVLLGILRIIFLRPHLSILDTYLYGHSRLRIFYGHKFFFKLPHLRKVAYTFKNSEGTELSQRCVTP
jgi:hypothetical protein